MRSAELCFELALIESECNGLEVNEQLPCSSDEEEESSTLTLLRNLGIEVIEQIELFSYKTHEKRIRTVKYRPVKRKTEKVLLNVPTIGNGLFGIFGSLSNILLLLENFEKTQLFLAEAEFGSFADFALTTGENWLHLSRSFTGVLSSKSNEVGFTFAAIGEEAIVCEFEFEFGSGPQEPLL